MGEADQSSNSQDSAQDLEVLIVEQVQQLAEELASRSLSAPVTLDTDLESGLGIDSLARIELLIRLERALRVTLPESAAVSARTPRDLLSAAGRASGGRFAKLTSTPIPMTSAAEVAGEIPEQATTLLEVLEWYLERSPNAPHIYLYGEAGEAEELSFQDLFESAIKAATALRRYGVSQGEPVAIMLPTGGEFFRAFLAVQLAGAVPVPLYPPFRLDKIEEHLLRESVILSNAGVRLLISFPEARALGRLLKSRLDQLQEVLTLEQLLGEAGESSFPMIGPEDIALIQYTSGSTGDPKGVVLTHANVLANVRAMGTAIEADRSDVFVSWLPLYHDMGLIGAWFGSLYYGIQLVVMSPLSFVARPHQWLWRIHQHRGTISSAPNFAYEICASKIDEEHLQGLDLSSWRLALNGAEPVSPTTLQRFIERFEPYGFSPEALMPVYGLAENAVGLAFRALRHRPTVDRIERSSLEQGGRAVPADSNETNALQFVACGSSLPNHQIRIVNALGQEVGEREEGLLQFRGPSSTAGYYRNTEANKKLFDGEWLNSGDYAYIADGEVYITGRAKDMIIRGGRNIYPQELEQAVGELEGIRKGCVAVFGVRDSDGQSERLVVLAETRQSDASAREKLHEAISELTFSLLQTRPDEIVLAAPRSIPKTSSGKLRRAATRELYERGEVGHSIPVWLQFVRLATTAVRPLFRRGRRLSADLLFGVYLWLLFIVLVPISWLLIVCAPGVSGSRRVARAAARFLFRLSGIPLRLSGFEEFPEEQCIITVNHASYLDSLVLTAVLPARFSFVAKRELTQQLFPRLALTALGTRFVERWDPRGGIEDTARINEAVLAGESVVFFPEGTLSREPGLRPFHLGAFKVAAETGVPILPLVIRGTRSILRDVQFFPRRGIITVVALEQSAPEKSDWSAALALRDRVRQQMLQHCGEPDLIQSPVSPPPPA